MNIFTVVEVGCLECENDHTVIGSFSNREEAVEALIKYQKDHPRDGWSDYSLEIFESILKQP